MCIKQKKVKIEPRLNLNYSMYIILLREKSGIGHIRIEVY